MSYLDSQVGISPLSVGDGDSDEIIAQAEADRRRIWFETYESDCQLQIFSKCLELAD